MNKQIGIQIHFRRNSNLGILSGKVIHISGIKKIRMITIHIHIHVCIEEGPENKI